MESLPENCYIATGRTHFVIKISIVNQVGGGTTLRPSEGIGVAHLYQFYIHCFIAVISSQIYGNI